jgi:LSD1 subclass zinc finger protein
VVTVALALNGYAVFRLYQRHRARPGRQPSAEWFVQDRSVPAVCGSCGAPLAFKAGEQRVTCGHCRAVVVASRGHGHQLIDLALAQSQIAALEAARAERKRVLAELSARRRTTLMASLLIYGACGVVFIPAFLLAYTLRTITRSAEQQMLDVARDLRGDFRAGLEGLFEWLDAYWIGPAPPDFTRIPGGTSALLESRWCVFAVYHDRPVLLLAWTGITDRALRPYLLLARPRQRGAETIARASRSAAAQRVRQRGFEYVLDYSGVALRGPSMSPDRFDTELVSALAQAAYELAEEP